MFKPYSLRVAVAALLLLLAMTATAQIQFNGKKAAVDKLTGTWLLTIPESAFGTDYTMTVSLGENVTQCSIDGVEVNGSFTFSNVGPGATYHLVLLDGTDSIAANIQFTYWPVIQIYGNTAKKPYNRGTVVITHPDSLLQETISSRVRWAGSSTADSNRKKHNFHLKFYNEDGTKRDMSFFGLRSDFHWRLDAGQVDFARVRNRVSKDIWASFAHQPCYAEVEPKTPYNYVRGDFVEVFLNDQYMGIYSLNEHMDRQQLKLKPYDYENGEFHGGLWKPMKWSYATVFCSVPEIDATTKNWDQFYVKYPNIDDVNPTNFQTLRDVGLFALSSENLSYFRANAKKYIDIPVFRDYYLLIILLQAEDNVGKNLYYACYDIATDKRMTMAIWDLDCSQGQYWSNEGNYYHFYLSGPEIDNRTKLNENLVMKRFLDNDPSFHGLATERYWELRGTTFHPDSIVARYEAYFDEMKSCGADRREIARWSRGSDLTGHELNFDNELEYLRDWWHRRIAYLDEHVFIPYPMGDLNFDHELSISDVTALIGYLLTQKDEGINKNRADINLDGGIDIGDVITMIRTLLLEP